MSSVRRERCAAIEAELPDGYRVRPAGCCFYSIYIDVSGGPIRRKHVGVFSPGFGGYRARPNGALGGQTFATAVEAALWVVHRWRELDAREG